MKCPDIFASSNHFTFIINFIENVKSEVMISKLRTVELATTNSNSPFDLFSTKKIRKPREHKQTTEVVIANN
jgi:hypothetical protein